jgi:hypothetical protein
VSDSTHLVATDIDQFEPITAHLDSKLLKLWDVQHVHHFDGTTKTMQHGLQHILACSPASKCAFKQGAAASSVLFWFVLLLGT